MTVNERRQADIDKLLRPAYPAVALKLVEDETVVPSDALRPYRDKGKHIALCQAFALTRRHNKTVYMRKEDHWCWNPLITYGAVKCGRGDPGFDEICKVIGIKDPEKAADFVDNFPKLPYGKYCGILTAPLDKADFEPDILLLYCSNAQLRTMLLAIKTQTGTMLDSSFDPIDSCVYSVIPPILEGNYRITLPDPGEYERALTGENEIIFSVPKQRMSEFFAGVDVLLNRGMTNDSFKMEMKEDFARPPFYNTLFSLWGLDTGEDWDK